jgi:SAM-dependent methyltransferase
MDDSSEDRGRFFARVYDQNLWQGRESRSGQGSDVAQAKTLIDRLPAVLRDYEIRSFLDVPCGDFNWMKEVDFGSTSYVGADIVSEIVDDNQRRYGSPSRRFMVLDLVRDPLPASDMIFVRDCFIHFSTDLIFEALANIAGSSMRYACLGHDRDHGRYPNGENVALDRTEGGVNVEFRPLDFEIPPFSFPPPIAVIPEDEHRKADGAGGDGVMAIWETSQIRAVLETRAHRLRSTGF